MEHFFVSPKTISFLPFKKMLDVDANLDSKTINFKVFQSSLHGIKRVPPFKSAPLQI